MLKVIGYVRVSTEEQSRDGVSLDAQREKVQGYARLYDLDLVGVITDAGVSAKTLDRPGLSEVLELLRLGEVDGVVIAKLDRLTRSVMDLGILIDRYFGEKGGRQLFSVSDAIDTRTPSGRLVLNILVSVAQWEREEIGRRTKDALGHKMANGERCGSLRYGYDLGVDGKTLVPNDGEQQVLALIELLAAQGRSDRSIAAALNDLNIPTKTRRGPWCHSAIARIRQRTPNGQAIEADSRP
jgi:site-specific DNA recombinase